VKLATVNIDQWQVPLPYPGVARLSGVRVPFPLFRIVVVQFFAGWQFHSISDLRDDRIANEFAIYKVDPAASKLVNVTDILGARSYRVVTDFPLAFYKLQQFAETTCAFRRNFPAMDCRIVRREADLISLSSLASVVSFALVLVSPTLSSSYP
jgi:hypothetical protein